MCQNCLSSTDYVTAVLGELVGIQFDHGSILCILNYTLCSFISGVTLFLVFNWASVRAIERNLSVGQIEKLEFFNLLLINQYSVYSNWM